MSDTAFYCHDPLRPFETKTTETAGELTPSGAGDFLVNHPETARELKEKYPHMLVSAHDKSLSTPRPLTHTIMWTMPELPGSGWTRRNVPNGTKAEQREAEHRPPQVTDNRAVTPQGDNTDGG